MTTLVVFFLLAAVQADLAGIAAPAHGHVGAAAVVLDGTGDSCVAFAITEVKRRAIER